MGDYDYKVVNFKKHGKYAVAILNSDFYGKAKLLIDLAKMNIFGVYDPELAESYLDYDVLTFRGLRSKKIAAGRFFECGYPMLKERWEERKKTGHGNVHSMMDFPMHLSWLVREALEDGGYGTFDISVS